MAEQEYTPTEARLRERVKGSLGEYAHEFGIDGEAAMDAWIDQALAERDNRVRADERAKQPDLPCDRGCNVNDGPMEDCSQHGRNPRDLWGIIEDLIQRLAAERAKRPDREQIAHALWAHDGGSLCRAPICRYNDDDADADYECQCTRCWAIALSMAVAVLALEPEAREETGPALRIDDDGAHIYWADPVEGCWVAFRRVDCVGEEELPERRLPAPETREEPKHGLIEDYTAVQAPDWAKVSGKLDARDITDAEVEAAAKAIVLDTLRATRSDATFEEVAVEQMPGALREARAALEAAREVQS